MSVGKSAMADVQTAVMATLAADSQLMAAVPGGVWDYVPDAPVWPYVCLESVDEVGADSQGSEAGSQGRFVTLTFVVFSNYQGRQEQFTVVGHLLRLLRETRITISGWVHLATWHDASRATSPFEAGNARAGSSSVVFRVHVLEA